jgi:hypothetical protein
MPARLSGKRLCRFALSVRFQLKCDRHEKLPKLYPPFDLLRPQTALNYAELERAEL